MIVNSLSWVTTMVNEELVLGRSLEQGRKQHMARYGTTRVFGVRFMAQYEMTAASTAMPRALGFDYVFTPTEQKRTLEDAGLGQLYMCFGAPGTGKSFFIMQLLKQLTDNARWKVPWGGLLIDPKATLLADVRKAVKTDIYAIGPKSSRGINLLQSHLKPRDLGVALTLAAQAAGITSSEAYWTNELKTLFGAGLQILGLLGDPITLNSLADFFLGIQVAEDNTTFTSLEIALDKLQAKMVVFTPQDAQRARAARTVIVSSYVKSKGDNAETVKSFVRQVLAPFLEPDLDYLSDASVTSSVSDLVFEEGKWVALELPKSMLAASRLVSTLTKILYQQAALSRLELYPKQTRRIFLIIDEYAEVASDLPGERLGDSIFFSQMRQFKVLAIVATQGVPMLKNSGVKDTWETMMSNSAAKIFFRVGDHETAELATKSLGEGEYILHNAGVQEGSGGFGRSQGSQLERRGQITTDVLLTGLERGQCMLVGTLDGKARAAAYYIQVEG
jgi:hypothetical protein